MRTDDADALWACRRWNLQITIAAEGQIVLADLIILRQIGIEVVLAIPLGERRDLAVECQRRAKAQLECPPIHHRQTSRQTKTDRTCGGVRRQAELRAAPAEQLRARQKLNVNFQ